MKERLQKILSEHGICSRREAEKLIEAGFVTVNGSRACIGESADVETDDIQVRGKTIKTRAERVYIMLNKPQGYITTMSDDRGRKTAAELVKNCGERVYPIGRLDMDSDGLLIFTNDGELANRLMHPSYEAEKTYIVRVTGDNIRNSAKKLAEPMEIDGYLIHPADVSILEEHGTLGSIAVTIHEGRNRQVRKMCAAVDLKVMRLTRVSESGVELGTLGIGQWRELTAIEIEHLKKKCRI